MRELDKSKRYNLEYLTVDEKEQVFNYLKEFSEWKDFNVDDFKQGLNKGICFNKQYNLWMMTNNDLNTNAKELFYTLENIQVDCRELSDEQIKEMADVFEKSGFDMGSLYKTDNYFHLNDDNDNYCVVGAYFDNKTTITYDKFMELFGRKEENFKKLVEVLNEELTEEYNKDKKPNQYHIGIDTFTRCESNMTKEEILTCCKFNIDKYNWRNKGQDLEDLEKIIAYANWGIKQLKQQ